MAARGEAALRSLQESLPLQVPGTACWGTLLTLTNPCRSQLKQHAKTHTRGRAREGAREGAKEVVRKGAREVVKVAREVVKDGEVKKPQAVEAAAEDKNTLDELQAIDEDEKHDEKEEEEEVVERKAKGKADTVTGESVKPIILHSTLC